MAKLKGLELLYNLLLKDAVKTSGPRSGILSIGPDTRKFAQKRFEAFVEGAKRQGVDLDKYTEQELRYIIELNKPKSPKVIPADSPEGKGITEALFGKKGEVVDMKGQKLDPNQPIMGGTQKVENTTGSLMSVPKKKGLAGMEYQTKTDMADARLIQDMYRTAGPRSLNEDKMYLAEFIADEAGKVLDDLPVSEQKVFIDRAEKALIKNVEKYKKFPTAKDPDFYDGPFDNDAEKLAEIKMSNKAFIDDIISEVNDMESITAMKEVNKVIRKEGKYKNLTDEDVDKIFKGTEDRTSGRLDDVDPEDMATGGRVGLFLGTTPKIAKGLSELRQLLKFFGKSSDKVKKPSDILAISNPKRLNKFSEDVKGKVSKQGIMATDLLTDYQTKMSKDRIKTVKEMLESAKNIRQSEVEQARLTNKMIEEMMSKGADRETAERLANALSNLAENVAGKQSGVPKLTDEGILQLENVVKNLETGGKTARELNATGGRAGFKDGMSRRKFLQIMGGLGAIPIVGKFLKFGKAAKSVKAVPIVKTPPVEGKPAWFDSLVNKVIKEGDDMTKQFATKDREIVHATKIDEDAYVRVYQDLDTGTVRVDIDDATTNVMGEQGDAIVSLEFKPGMADETTKGKPADQFTAVENDYRNYADGPDDYVTETVENVVTDTKDLTSDLTKIKLYAKGQKKPTMKEFIESKKRKDQVKYAEEQPSQYAADRGPEFDPGDYDDYASGGIAGMLGE